MGDFRKGLQVFELASFFVSPHFRRKVVMHRRRRSIRVLLAEDNDTYARTVGFILSACEDVELVGRARDGAEGVGLAFALEPECILMDLSMPIIDGFEATRTILSRLPSVRVVMLTSSDDPADRGRALAAGATSYLTKQCSFHDLEATVEAACSHRPGRSGACAVAAGGLA